MVSQDDVRQVVQLVADVFQLGGGYVTARLAALSIIIARQPVFTPRFATAIANASVRLAWEPCLHLLVGGV